MESQKRNPNCTSTKSTKSTSLESRNFPPGRFIFCRRLVLRHDSIDFFPAQQQQTVHGIRMDSASNSLGVCWANLFWGASFFWGGPRRPSVSFSRKNKNKAFKVFEDIGAFHYTEFRFLLHKASSGVLLFILRQNPHLTDWTGFLFPSMGYHRQPHSAKVSPPHDLFAILCVFRMICHELLIP